MFKKLGIKAVPVTLKGNALAKAAICIILGELMLPLLCMGHTMPLDSFLAPVPLVHLRLEPLFRLLWQACM